MAPPSLSVKLENRTLYSVLWLHIQMPAIMASTAAAPMAASTFLPVGLWTKPITPTGCGRVTGLASIASMCAFA
jgi:ABC-type cobalamin transport system ATPase subunit